AKIKRAGSLALVDPVPYASALPKHELSWRALYQAERRHAGVKFVEQHALLFRGEKGVFEARLGEPDNIHCREPHPVGMTVFVADGGLEHGRIVARKCDGEAAAKERWERMLFVAGRIAAELARQSPGAEIAGRADLQGNVTGREKIHGALVAQHADPVSNALSAQDFDGLADEFGPSD